MMLWPNLRRFPVVAVFVDPYLLVYVAECPGQYTVGARLASERLPDDHEAVTHDHHFVDLQQQCISLKPKRTGAALRDFSFSRQT